MKKLISVMLISASLFTVNAAKASNEEDLYDLTMSFLLFPEFFEAGSFLSSHMMACVQDDDFARENVFCKPKYMVLTAFAVGATAYVFPEAGTAITVGGLITNMTAQDLNFEKEAARVVLADAQEFYSTGKLGVSLESMTKVMNKIAGKEISTEEAVAALVARSNEVLN